MLTRKRRFRYNYLFVYTLLLFLMFMMFKVGPILASNQEKDYQPGVDEAQVEVMVRKGDTLWGIAKNYASPQEDIRIVIARIQNMNGLKSSEYIHPGQLLIIPVKE